MRATCGMPACNQGTPACCLTHACMNAGMQACTCALPSCMRPPPAPLEPPRPAPQPNGDNSACVPDPCAGRECGAVTLPNGEPHLLTRAASRRARRSCLRGTVVCAGHEACLRRLRGCRRLPGTGTAHSSHLLPRPLSALPPTLRPPHLSTTPPPAPAGETVVCGACTLPDTCNPDGLCENTGASCVPKEECDPGFECGYAPDNCECRQADGWVGGWVGGRHWTRAGAAQGRVTAGGASWAGAPW